MTIQDLSDRISSDGGGDGGGAVDSVNGKTGEVILKTDDIDDAGQSHQFVDASEKSKIAEVDNKEDSLGDPSVDGYILSSDTDGTRSWIPAPEGGGGAVDSVNGEVGEVVLDADNIDDSSTDHKFATQSQLDQIATNASDITGKEDDLGVPSEDGYVLTSDTNGNRAWVSVSSEGGDSGVISINGEQGIVTLDPDDLDDASSAHKFISQAELNQIATNESDITGINSSLSSVAGDVSDNAGAILVNGTNISNNSSDIAQNASDITSNTNNISLNSSAIDGKEDDLGDPSISGQVLSSSDNGQRTWISLPEAPEAPVDSVFGRTGEITAQFADYNADQVDDSTTINKFATASQLLQISANTVSLGSKEDSVAAGTTAQYYRGDKTFQPLNKLAVGLSDVDNTSDADKPVSDATQLELDSKIEASEKGVANGVATLDSQGKVDTNQLPSYVSAVQEFSNFDDLPLTGESDVIYITQDTGYTYRWSGSSYVQLTDQTAVWGQIGGSLSSQTDLQTALAAKVPTSSLGVSGGVATLDGSGTVPLSQIPEGIGGGLTPELVNLTGGPKVLEDGKAYLVKPDEVSLGNNQLILPTGSEGIRIFVSDINYKFGTYNVVLQAQTGQTIDSFDNLILDVDHCWIDLFFIDGEWKTVDPYSGG